MKGKNDGGPIGYSIPFLKWIYQRPRSVHVMNGRKKVKGGGVTTSDDAAFIFILTTSIPWRVEVL